MITTINQKDMAIDIRTNETEYIETNTLGKCISKALSMQKKLELDSYKIIGYQKSSGAINSLHIDFYNKSKHITRILLLDDEVDGSEKGWRNYFSQRKIDFEKVTAELAKTNLRLNNIEDRKRSRNLTEETINTYKEEDLSIEICTLMDFNKHKIFGINLRPEPKANYKNVLEKLAEHWSDYPLELPNLKLVKGYGGFYYDNNKITIGAGIKGCSMHKASVRMGFTLLHESAHWVRDSIYQDTKYNECHDLLFRQILYLNWKFILGSKVANKLLKSFNSNTITKGVIESFEKFKQQKEELILA